MHDQDPVRERTTALVLGGGESAASSEALFALVYDELHLMAHRQLAREPAGHTLRTTALVHEAYLRLVDDARVGSKGRAYFFGAVARAMRQVLVDHARRRSASKRGGGLGPMELADGTLAAAEAANSGVAVDALAEELIDLDRALEQLGNVDPRRARVVECRFFAGLDVAETAAVLGVSERTVKADWAFARAWLRRTLDSGGGDSIA
jgi:RNA polymerase sigma factor (TIGR02999 family)